MTQNGKNPTTLFTFHYKGVNKASQKVAGTIEAPSMAMAKVGLRKEGIVLNKIMQKRTPLFKQNNQKITPGDISVFSRQLATLCASGIPLMQAFDILAKGQSNRRFKTIIEQMKQDVGTGLTLSETLQKHPSCFNKLFCSLVDAGEQSGSLDIMLERIAAYKEKIEIIKKKIKKALTYPLAVLITALLVTTGLLIFVVPQFELLFQGFGAELPLMTRAVLHLSNIFKSYWYLIFGLLIGAIYCFTYARTHVPGFTELVDQSVLKLPVLGSIIKMAIIARFTRTLAITFAAGLPLVNALGTVAGTMGNLIFFKATEHIIAEVASGQQINKAMAHTQLFPDMVIQMVAIGEESGTLEKMLNKIADFYEEDVDNSVDSLSNLLEPIIMSMLGVLVGGLVIAMYLPIFKLGSAI